MTNEKVCRFTRSQLEYLCNAVVLGFVNEMGRAPTDREQEMIVAGLTRAVLAPPPPRLH